MIKIGITGGIGAGKSFVSKIFASMGVPLYNADFRAKWIIQNDQNLIAAIKETFGNNIYNHKNELDRVALAKIVFNDKKQLEKLNAIVHPAVSKDGEEWYANLPRHKLYGLKEAALLFETGTHKKLDKVIVVSASKELRINRVVERDNISRADVLARMDKQLAEKDKLQLADYVIYNEGTQALIPQIWKVHQQIKKLRNRN